MATTKSITFARPEFRFRFLTLCVTGSNVVHITASAECTVCTLTLVGFVLIFADHLPVQEGGHA
jgi:hypothetical protein